MRYDELPEKIDEKIESVESVSLITATPWRVLRAVVELHKPIYYPDKPEGPVWCNQCAEGRGYAKYPCPTIQAIEERLK